jgi:hypothetical protein
MRRKQYTSRDERRADFIAGYVFMAGAIVLLPQVANALTGNFSANTAGIFVLVAGLVFLVGTGIYRPWMAIGGLGCLGTLIALGLLAALFVAVVCSSMFR